MQWNIIPTCSQNIGVQGYFFGAYDALNAKFHWYDGDIVQEPFSVNLQYPVDQANAQNYYDLSDQYTWLAGIYSQYPAFNARFTYVAMYYWAVGDVCKYVPNDPSQM